MGMTNFEKYIQELTVERFVGSMILNCGECPAHPCAVAGDQIATGTECQEILLMWCNAEQDDGTVKWDG